MYDGLLSKVMTNFIQSFNDQDNLWKIAVLSMLLFIFSFENTQEVAQKNIKYTPVVQAVKKKKTYQIPFLSIQDDASRKWRDILPGKMITINDAKTTHLSSKP